jgi:hypothetical protein
VGDIRCDQIGFGHGTVERQMVRNRDVHGYGKVGEQMGKGERCPSTGRPTASGWRANQVGGLVMRQQVASGEISVGLGATAPQAGKAILLFYVLSATARPLE